VTRPTKDELARALLDSFSQDEVPRASKERAFAAFGVVGAVTSAVTTLSAGAEAAGGAAPAATLAAKHVVTVGGLSLVKAAVTGAALGAAVMFAGERVMMDRPAPAPIPAAMAIERAGTANAVPLAAEPTDERDTAGVAAGSETAPFAVAPAVVAFAPAATSHGEAMRRPSAPPVSNTLEKAPPPSPPVLNVPAPSAPAAASDDRVGATLTGEVTLLDRARAALHEGAPARALGELDAYDAAFPAGTLRQEAAVLRIEVLVRRGDERAARISADAFALAHPRSGYLQKIRELLARLPKPHAP
jgi:hypothetical protein